MPRLRVLVVFGTRPEAIKLCVLIRHLKAFSGAFEVRSCVTAQHRSMLDQVLRAFEVTPDVDLDLMEPSQTLHRLTSKVVGALAKVLSDEQPDIVLVQGDTTTTFATALAAFYKKIPVGHIEAGLRTNDRYSPFPEEMNRRLATQLSDLHFAATERAADNLRREAVPAESIFVTGNTVIDALLEMKSGLESGRLRVPDWPFLRPDRKLILVTAHRRESFGEGFERICKALAKIAQRADVQLVYPVHRNPQVSGPVLRNLSDVEAITLIDPVDYVPLIDLMRRSHFILTDSGGVQEEAPSLGKPVLVMRQNTERPEAIEAGTARLVGSDPGRIIEESNRLLDDVEQYQCMAQQHNPFGDGRACRRIAEALLGEGGKLLR